MREEKELWVLEGRWEKSGVGLLGEGVRIEG